MILAGVDETGAAKEIRFYLIAKSGDGPHVPCIPAIVLATRLGRGEPPPPGARPCLDLIDLDAYLGALEGLDIETFVEGADG